MREGRRKREKKAVVCLSCVCDNLRKEGGREREWVEEKRDSLAMIPVSLFFPLTFYVWVFFKVREQ